MLILSGSLPKSGSTWLFHMTDALLISSGRPGIQELRKTCRLESVIPQRHCDISYTGPAKLLRLLPATLRGFRGRGHDLLVRTHFAPSRSFRLMMRLGLAKATYVYRDPRDVVLSAMDHGQRGRDCGSDHELMALTTLDKAIDYTRANLMPHFNAWMDTPGVLKLRYEDLTADTPGSLTQISEYLGLNLADEAIRAVAQRFDKSAMNRGDRVQMLVNRGTAARFRNEMTDEQLRITTDAFAPELERMGYAA